MVLIHLPSLQFFGRHLSLCFHSHLLFCLSLPSSLYFHSNNLNIFGSELPFVILFILHPFFRLFPPSQLLYPNIYVRRHPSSITRFSLLLFGFNPLKHPLQFLYFAPSITPLRLIHVSLRTFPTLIFRVYSYLFYLPVSNLSLFKALLFPQKLLYYPLIIFLQALWCILGWEYFCV